ncbi:MAG: hypothetical protein JWO41_557 [Candidatus Saccharibacteria bacterium]|nr:hypothetical protein [Candidatus Saccharibacteria bacterium]
MNKAGFNQYKKAKAKFHRSPWFILGTWVLGFGSIGLLYLSGRVLSNDIAGFRSCSDSNGIVVLNCGKSSLNVGDLVLFVLFIACIALTMSLFTAGWRMLQRAK